MASPSATVSSPHSLSSGATPGSQAMSPPDSSSLSMAHQAAVIQQRTGSLPSGSVNGKMALPPQSQLSATAPVGPASKVYTIPPRPKPGRKPKEPAADDVRKEQNRAAQKKFRNKQHDKIQCLTEELDQKNVTIVTLQAEINNLNAALADAHAQTDDLRRQLHAFEAERADYKRKADEVERKSKRTRVDRLGSNGDLSIVVPPHSRTTGFGSSDAAATPGNPTPPYEMEIDFTNFGQPAATDTGDDCGFCTNGDFCACSMKAKTTSDQAIDSVSPAAVPLKRRYHPAAPGSCEACQRDPEQARKCQELARTSAYSQTPLTPGTMLGMKSGPDGLLNEAPPERTSCSDFLAKFRPLDTTQYRSIIGKLHTFPHMGAPGQDDGRFKPALDLDAREAAEALTSLAAKPERH